VVGPNGGGAYLIPYLVAVFCFVVPLMILELAVDRHLRGNVVSSFGGEWKHFRVIGRLVCAVVFIIS
jgi:NSS family neurotransmitter:Na+ symporter